MFSLYGICKKKKHVTQKKLKSISHPDSYYSQLTMKILLYFQSISFVYLRPCIRYCDTTIFVQYTFHSTHTHVIQGKTHQTKNNPLENIHKHKKVTEIDHALYHRSITLSTTMSSTCTTSIHSRNTASRISTNNTSCLHKLLL